MGDAYFRWRQLSDGIEDSRGSITQCQTEMGFESLPLSYDEKEERMEQHKQWLKRQDAQRKTLAEWIEKWNKEN